MRASYSVARRKSAGYHTNTAALAVSTGRAEDNFHLRFLNNCRKPTFFLGFIIIYSDHGPYPTTVVSTIIGDEAIMVRRGQTRRTVDKLFMTMKFVD